jgi:MoaA/NifB/PqqE/SkfB family radical SAM enzyme
MARETSDPASIPGSRRTPELEVQLGHACSNRCVFCVSGRLNERRLAKPVPTSMIVAALEAARAQGTTRVTLLGGEPTIHRDFLAVLAKAQQLGFSEVVVFTNGVMLAQEGFLDRVLDLGKVLWRVSVQGPEATSHDAVTGRRGSFARLLSGLKLLHERDQSVTANTCVTKLNLARLPGLAGIASRFGIKAWHVDMVRPEDCGDPSPERLRSILPTYADMTAPLREMFEAFDTDAPTVALSLGNYPFCLLPEWADHIHHGGQATWVCDSGGGTELGSSRDKYSQQLGARIHPEPCEDCVFMARCSGVPAIYLDLFGAGELRALSLEQLADVDHRAANLPLLMRPWWERFIASAPPRPWVIGEVVVHPRERTLDVSLSHPSAGRRVLRLRPPHPVQQVSEGISVLVNAHAEIELVGGENGDAASTEALAHWLRQRAASVGPTTNPDPPAVVRGGQVPASASRVDIKIGFACNNRCEFCVQGNKREHHGPRSIEQMRADLEEGRRLGATGIVLTGGEPTIHASVLEVARLAREIGYSVVQAQSNGRLFSHLPFCKEAIASGINEFALALHGVRAQTHDRLTRAPGSFRQTVAGIRNLVKLGQRVLTNTVINSVNFRELPELAQLLVKLGVSQYQFAFVHILGTAAKNAAWLVPRKTDVMPFVKAGLDVGLRAGVRCMTEAIPFCFLQGYEECVAEQIIPRTVVFDADVTLEDYTIYRQTEGKAKGPMCARCLYFDRCEGPWIEYPALFGWDELCPAEREDGAEIAESPGASVGRGADGRS